MRDGRWSKQFVRYVVTGFVTFLFGLIQFKILYNLIPESEYHNSIVWFFNFILGTVWIHALHRKYTFKDASHRSYLTSLFRTYFSYGSAILIGAVLMLLLCDIGNMHHLLGWGVTNTVMSFFNFYVMRSFAMISWD